MAYTHLNSEERHYIETELKSGTSQSDIAKKLGRSPRLTHEDKHSHLTPIMNDISN